MNYLEESLFDKLVVAQLVTIFSSFMDTEGLLPWAQEPAAGLYSEPDETNPPYNILFFEDPS
jgi:hypothetical protein